MRRGEVRWYRFRSPDKERSVVLLTRDAVMRSLGEVTTAPITSTIRSIASQVVLTETDGMPHACAVSLDHVQTVQRTRIGALITTLNPGRMDEIRSALLFALDMRERPTPGL